MQYQACAILDLRFQWTFIIESKSKRDAKDRHLELIYIFLPLFTNKKADAEEPHQETFKVTEAFKSWVWCRVRGSFPYIVEPGDLLE